MKTVLLIFAIIFLSACQESASSNKDLSDNAASTSLKYPLKTGQKDVFVFEDIATNPSTFYYDDGFYKNGYIRDFKKNPDGTVYNANYDLYWQDDEVVLEHNMSAAKEYCDALTLAGYTDWRLPNLHETMTLLNLNSGTDLRESEFSNMPNGFYFTNNEVSDTFKTYVMGFGEKDFNISKIDKVYDVNASNSDYGTLVGISQVPKYDSKGVLLYISDSKIYYDQIHNILTTITTYTLFDDTGAITSVDGPFIDQEIPLHPPIIDEIEDSYIKCVRGEEIKGFTFERDHNRGVVVDKATNLMWQDNQDVIEKKYQWGEAVKYCSDLSLASYKDWRVPTISELTTIVDFSKNSTYAVNDEFIYKSANKFHSSSNLCYGENCYQKNLQLNACGFLDEKITQNIEVDINPYDKDTTEPYYKVRCVRSGTYN
ncbi:DUF1566 domain-containing protein [bacterium]|nr:DUF1566 domain-containing protein [bacterium]MBU1990964.1 DUF1566 domain-containing protein [bacterium]